MFSICTFLEQRFYNKLMKIALSGASGSIGLLLKRHLLNKNSISTISLRKELNFYENGLAHRNDVLIHLASLNANLRTENDRLLELSIAKKAIKYCKQSKTKSLIFFSTSQVYGYENTNAELSQESDPCLPKNIYANAKLDCEKYFIQECQENNINLIIFRACPFIDLNSNSKVALLGKLARDFRFSIEFNKANLNSKSFLTLKNLLLITEGALVILKKPESRINIILNAGDKYPVSTNEIVKIISQKYSVRPLIIKAPKIFELIVSKMPLIKNLYKNLVISHVVDINLAEKTLGIKLLETYQSISND